MSNQRAACEWVAQHVHLAHEILLPAECGCQGGSLQTKKGYFSDQFHPARSVVMKDPGWYTPSSITFGRIKPFGGSTVRSDRACYAYVVFVSVLCRASMHACMHASVHAGGRAGGRTRSFPTASSVSEQPLPMPAKFRWRVLVIAGEVSGIVA